MAQFFNISCRGSQVFHDVLDDSARVNSGQRQELSRQLTQFIFNMKGGLREIKDDKTHKPRRLKLRKVGHKPVKVVRN